ncbi:GNAT family N-acetyltransferase [uncultured Desulfobacter sp.]|uniref:GNAT family N-acetyltransferase n=1 Tax=uncultured Desulfobacter sp. TaxID=240139 RepID=UPI002AA890AF|nr:GNAT family N-acetyltransferase [uncultured Desulfobacter sp.]
MNLLYLQWDSQFFGLKIGKIVCNNENYTNELNQLVNLAKRMDYSLVYVFSLEHILLNEKELLKHNALLVDRKIVYQLKTNKKMVKNDDCIFDYSKKQISKDLLNLTYKSGQYSRFLLDKKLPENAFENLYKAWIEKSLSKEIADKVFVAQINHIVIGFATLKIKDGKGQIGLIAVSEQAQGQKIGSKLIDACILYLQEKSINKLIVHTQLANTQACGFYENYGFKKELITNIYHFWI